MNFRAKIKKQGYFLIAEIGNNHGGSIKTAKKMIYEAHNSGADAVKLQYILPENLVHPSEKLRVKQLKKLCLTKKEIVELYRFSKKKKIQLFASIFDIYELSFFNKFQKFFKIASGDNNFDEMFKRISKFRKPTFISTGFLSEKEVKNLNSKIFKYWDKKFAKNNICIMHCISKYPTDQKDLNLLFINKMSDNLIKGFSDHSIGINACLAANILGAKVIEKHFTLNKRNIKFRDHQLSSDPKELLDLKKQLDKNQILLGKMIKKVSKSEIKEKKKSRRGLVTKIKIKKNQIIRSNNLKYLRPEGEKSLENFFKIINKKSKKTYSENEYL